METSSFVCLFASGAIVFIVVTVDDDDDDDFCVHAHIGGDGVVSNGILMMILNM